MKENEKSNFAKMLTAVGELDGKKVSLILLSLYWSALERFNFADIRQAIAHHVNNPDVGQFMPKPADIVRFLEGNSEAKALQAWSKVESAIRRLGSYGSVAFDDPIIHVVILEMGGWPTLCSTLAEKMPFRTAEFMKRYQRYMITKLTHFPKYLVGTFEQSNQCCGYQNDTIPALVGDAHLALSVISEGVAMAPIAIHCDHFLAADCIKKQAKLTKALPEKSEKEKA